MRDSRTEKITIYLHMLEKIPTAVEDPGIELQNLTLIIAKEVQGERNLFFDQKKELFSIVRKWRAYVEEHKIDQKDFLSVRYHLLEFSKKYFSRNSIESDNHTEVQRISLETLQLPDGTLFTDYINTHFADNDIFSDKHVALYGGVARLALKLHASKNSPGYNFDLI